MLIKKNKIPKKSWKEKVEEGTGKNPLMCTRCEIEMEFKGQVCLKKGKLVITYAKCIKARRRLEELIGYEPPGKKKDAKGTKRKERLGSEEQNSSKSMVRFICLQCNIEEDIPEEVVQYCDAMDDGDIEVPPRSVSYTHLTLPTNREV